MKVHVRRRVRFSAAHSYQNLPEEAARKMPVAGRIHGHNFIVDLTCCGNLDTRTGMVVNITEIDKVLKSVVGPLDGSFLEQDHPQAAWGIPSTENLALWIWEQCDGRIPGASLGAVRVAESEFLWSEYRGEDARVVYVTQAYEFSAAHRLHSPELPDEENCQIFAKCNNPNGHGHNYGLEVTLRAPVDPRTGLAVDVAHLDAVVTSRVVDRFDHRHLNLDLPEFAGINPTAENIAVVIWKLLREPLGDKLHKICLRETERNYFEYYGEE